MATLFVSALLLGLLVLVVRLLSPGASQNAPQVRPVVPPRAGPPTAPRLATRSNSQFDVTQRPQTVPKRTTAVSGLRSSSAPHSLSRDGDEKPIRVTSPESAPASRHSIPKAPPEFGPGRWIAEGQPVTIADTSIPGGMLYVGSSLKAPNGEQDPCLIDPCLPVASTGDYAEDQMGYWPSYSRITPQARRAYLNWLSGGRKDPGAEIGFVFLFFYGLERRAIIDATAIEPARYDRPRIASELRRLLDVYGEKSHSFRRYAVELLDWISLSNPPPRLYDEPTPSFPRSSELPLYLRLALGQAAVDEASLPAQLALAWTRLDPRIVFRTAARRCPKQFEQLFVNLYASTYGPGLVLPRNRTRLKFVYRPASSGFAGCSDFELAFNEIPDVTVLAGPVTKLQGIVDSATEALAPFSRIVGRNPTAGDSLEAQLLLPPSLWPEALRQTLEELRSRLTGDALLLKYGDLAAALGATAELTREKTKQLARSLATTGIGFEPDVERGARPPKPEDSVALFPLLPSETESAAQGPYLAASLTLQLASTVATADGVFGSSELEHLREAVLSWKHLSTNQSRRLLAHLQLLMRSPMTLPRLRKKLEALDSTIRETLASFMAAVAQSDGVISADEVKLLERAYRALGVDPDKVFSDLHSMATNEKPLAAAGPETAGLKLDSARIAELQRDTARVSTLLAGIFAEEDESASATPVEPIEDEQEEASGSRARLLGLDVVHSTLARTMLARPSWSREELSDLADDLELMLDGALEQMNEAALDAHGIPFFEGEDPLVVNTEMLEKLNQ